MVEVCTGPALARPWPDARTWPTKIKANFQTGLSGAAELGEFYSKSRADKQNKRAGTGRQKD